MKARIWSIALALALLIVFAANASAASKFILIYYDGHMHTTRSDGSGSVTDIKATALNRHLNAVIVTDHCRGLKDGAWASLVADAAAATDQDFLALPGFEVTGNDGLLNRAHVNALGADDPFVDDTTETCPEEVWPNPLNEAGTGPLYPENITKWVDFIHSKQGIAVHNHPSGTTKLSYGVNDMEVYNQGHVDDVASYASALGYPPQQAYELGLTLNNFAIYGERDANMLVPFPGFPYPIPLRYGLWYATENYIPPYIGQWLGAPEAPLSSWDQLLMAYVNGEVNKPIFGLANSDSHNTGDIAGSTVGVAKNGAYVKALTAEELYKAIKAGRTFATTGPSLNLDVDGELMGDTAYISGGVATVHLTANADPFAEMPNAVLVKIDVIKNGVVLQTINPMTPTHEANISDNVTADGYYRIEVTSLDTDTGKYYFAYSNPVFVRLQ